ncbi:hypothetical protein A2U01_0074034 [Trifolium medium]|uniref:Uncharacterized protein n=1 Tax=Trifolium medium TaxID=97028 RepID=A0A392SV85_9FABA|nr:hypothetical protein [Trifolium medium]
MHGNEKMAAEDVWGIGKAIGVKFNCDNANRFSALVGTEKGKHVHGNASRGMSEGK